MKTPTKPFALCIDNTDYQASLIPGKIYAQKSETRSWKLEIRCPSFEVRVSNFTFS